MDPTNNPTPTPNPAPNPAPDAVPPVPEPVPAPEPTPAPAGPAAPVEPVPPVAPNPAPVNPVITPGTNPIAGNPAFQQTGGLAATDPIMQPEPAKAPDPIEEELKAPMRAAAPVPGSIGSAVSGPDGGEEPASSATTNPFTAPQEHTPNVAFNDPAAQPDAVNPAANPAAKPKKKTSKTTMIALIVVVVMIVVALIAVLAMQLMGSGSGSTSSNNSSSSSASTADNTNTTIDDNTGGDINDDNTGTGDETSSLASINIVCNAEIVTEQTTTTNEATFRIVNGKLTDAISNSKTVDEKGDSTEDSITVTFSEMVVDGLKTGEGSFVEEDGTISVELDKVSAGLEEWLSNAAATQYACELN